MVSSPQGESRYLGEPELGAVSRAARRRRRRARRRAQSLALALLAVVVVACAFYSGRSSAATVELRPAVVAYWVGVARCEQPLVVGGRVVGVRWNHPGPTYQGGLGFYWATWDDWARELGLYDRYPDAGLAPARVQIRVADFGRRVHSGYWGCA